MARRSSNRVVAQSQDMEDGRADSSLPAAGQEDLGVHLGLRELPRIRGSRRSQLIDLNAVELLGDPCPESVDQFTCKPR